MKLAYYKNLGDIVLCDFCNDDYTVSDDTGGLIFGSKAVCPNCTPKLSADAKRYNEEHFIKARCKPDQSFADFVREFRSGPAEIKVYTGN
jgi:hydrogenase maturation factor HypF (carbamoyltransferase family)